MSNPPNGTGTTQAPQTQALTPYQERRIALREEIGQDSTPRAIVPRTFAEAQAFADAIAYSSLVPEALKERAPDILMIVLAGAELGIAPIKALSLYHVMEGVPKLSADGIAGVVSASPLCEYLEPVEQSDQRVTWKTKRVGRPEQSLTIDHAAIEQAGLLRPSRNGSPSNHVKYPRAMKNARCKAELCRLVYPEVVAGLVSAEEARDLAYAKELDAQRAGVPESLAAPPPPAPTFPKDTSKQGDSTPAGGKGKASSSSKAASKPPIDAQSSEPKSTPSSPTPSASGAAGDGPLGSPTTSSGTTDSAPSSSSPPTESPRPTEPASSQSSAPVVTSSTSAPASSQSSAVAADDDGFGGSDVAPDVMTIEGFRAELAAATADTIDTVKQKWLPWSLKGQPGFAHAGEMRTLFSKRRAELGK